jgi:hypothetical protein
MIEVYLFHVMFALQILVLSVLYPRQLIQRINQGLARYPAGDFPQLYPEGEEATLRELGQYQRGYWLLNQLIAGLGLLLLGLLFGYMRKAGWDDGPVVTAVGLYFILQLVPMLLFAWFTLRGNSYLRNVMQGEKRKAVLQRRGLFDFVSPAVVFITLLCYPAFIVMVLYFRRDPIPEFKSYVFMLTISLVYVWNAFWIYRTLYGRRSNPLQSNEERLHEIGTGVKISVYSCLACVLFFMLKFALVLLDRQSVEPLALSCFFVSIALMCYQTLKMPPDATAPNGLHTGSAHKYEI